MLATLAVSLRRRGVPSTVARHEAVGACKCKCVCFVCGDMIWMHFYPKFCGEKSMAIRFSSSAIDSALPRLAKQPAHSPPSYSHLLAGASWMAEYGNPDTDEVS